MRLIFTIFTVILIFWGCSDFKDSLAGNLGEKCFGNGTCRGDLICVDNVCVESIVDVNDEDDLSDDLSDEALAESEETDDDEAEFDHDAVGDDDLSDEVSDTESETLTESDETPDETDDTVFDEDADEIPDEVPDDAVNCSTAVFDSGAGTAGDPYVISTPEDLNKIRCFPGLNYFRQTADIDLSEFKTGEGWVPIGSQTEKFAGTYYGNGFKITNLFINRPTENNQGLFGYVLNGSLNNIKIENIDVTGSSNTGSLAGIIEGTLVNNCYGRYGIESASVNIKGESYTGGLIGYSYEGSTISNSNSILGVTGDENVGGLVGMSYKSNVERSYATGSVSGNKFAGGLVGYLMGSTTQKAKIENCYSRGEVERKSGTNGNIGSFAGISFYGEINYCYSTGSVVYTGGTNPTDKGFTGGTGGTVAFFANFFDTETTLQTSGTTATGLMTSQMKSSAFFSGEGWDFTVTWGSDGSTNEGYMYLK